MTESAAGGGKRKTDKTGKFWNFVHAGEVFLNPLETFLQNYEALHWVILKLNEFLN